MKLLAHSVCLACLLAPVHAADNVLLIRGAIPGAPGDYVVIREAKKRSRKLEADRVAKAAAREAARPAKKGARTSK